MILLGAGSSIPFGIPGMKGSTDQFIATHGESELIAKIREAIDKSAETIGVRFSFDLESLLSVLNDLSGAKKEKPSLCTNGLFTDTAEYKSQKGSREIR